MKREKLTKSLVFKLILVLSISFFFTACFNHYNVYSDTYADVQMLPKGFAKGKSFYVVSKNQDDQNSPSENILLSKEIGRKIQKILQEKGYKITDRDKADYTLCFSYNMTSEDKILNVPKYIPGDVTKTKAKVIQNGEKKILYESEKEYPGKVVFITETQKIFTRGLSIDVYENKNSSSDLSKEPIWTGSAKSAGTSSDFREMADYLLVGAFKFFGQNTDKNIETVLFEGNKDVKRLREKVL